MLLAQFILFSGEQRCFVMHPSINILWQEGVEGDEKHLIFQSGALTQINAFFFLLPSEISPPSSPPLLLMLPVFVAGSLCRSPNILGAPFAPSSPPPYFPTPTLLSTALITQLLLGNVVPAGPSISRVATATVRTHADTVNMLVFRGYMHRKTLACTQCCNIHRGRSRQCGNDCQNNLMHLQHPHISGHNETK